MPPLTATPALLWFLRTHPSPDAARALITSQGHIVGSLQARQASRDTFGGKAISQSIEPIRSLRRYKSIPVMCGSQALICARHAALRWHRLILCRAHRGSVTPRTRPWLPPPIRGPASQQTPIRRQRTPPLDTSQHVNARLHQGEGMAAMLIG